jgi:hypothetical protein
MASNRKAQQATCKHDWFKGIASQWCLKCGKAQVTAEFAEKAAHATRVEAK